MGEIERLQRVVTKLQRNKRDLMQRLHEEKKIADCMITARLLVEPLWNAQQPASSKKQQLRIAETLKQRAAASTGAAAAETNKPTGGSPVEKEEAAPAEDDLTGADVKT